MPASTGCTIGLVREALASPVSDFDYSANPNVVPAAINNLATCDSVRKGEPLW
ncbi:hypothetical protein ACWEP8_28415 [Streptomyces hydrogenans]